MDEGRRFVFYITEGERFFSQREKRLKEYGGMPLAGGVERFFCYDKRISHLPNVSLIEGIVIMVRGGANANISNRY